jgi:putative tryptophan/tyrosine transport system substrate-binding protein
MAIHILRREFIFTLGGAAAAWPLAARAQQPSKVWRIGFIAGASRPASLEVSQFGGFQQGMREHGYIEGKDFVMEWRFADAKPERYSEFAAEFVRSKVDVIVIGTPAAVRTVQQATSTTPIVMGYSVDPVGNGFVASLARPGGNTTGLSSSQDDATPKQGELLTTAVPSLSRVGLLANPDSPNFDPVLKNVRTAVQKVGLVLVPVEMRSPQEVPSAFATMARERVGAVMVMSDALTVMQRNQIAELALKDRLPTIFPLREYVVAGGLMAYGENIRDFFLRAALYVDKILKGAKPTDLPIEQPTRFFLTINLKTAKALGLDVPPMLLARADEVIE